ncbi:hypothetical protein GCM10010470_55020 [Saccharopolyspora taberi]|uniref:Uncharacterized protein n=1 Tax=Saccharopolyspora taberi TaxID=60895 RepID=A0ABN3VK17_9PSEU
MTSRLGPKVVWWVVDQESDQRHATLTDPRALPDGAKVPRLCGGQIAHAKPGSRTHPGALGIETFCGSCVAQSTGHCYGHNRQDHFYY